MKGLKIVVSCLLIAIFMISPLRVSADTMEASSENFYEMEVPHPEGGHVSVAVPTSTQRTLTVEELQRIIIEQGICPGDKITFWRVGNSADKSNAETISWTNSDTQNARGLNITYKTEKSTIYSYTIHDELLTSCARGMSTTLAREYVKSFDMQLEGEVPFVKSQIGSSFTGRVSETYVFNGPPEGSKYNSRSFYIRFTARKIQWQQHEYVNGALRKTISGYAYETYTYDIYSVDKIIV